MQVNGTNISVVKGDLTDTEIEAIGFYAEPSLKLGSGFGNAISMRGGPSVQEELNSLAPLGPEQAIVSKAGDLKISYIVHANGPKFRETDMDGKLRNTLLNALLAAEEKSIKKIAFPPMGAGFYGIPLEQCAKIMIDTFKDFAQNATKIDEIKIVVMNNREFKPFNELLN
jgi:O-acetyl-ADP-ribose deacetylase